MPKQIQIRRDTALAWTTSNPILAQGEMGYETDTGKFKIGNGMNVWSGLSYIVNGATGTFTSADSKTITVTNGIITSIT